MRLTIVTLPPVGMPASTPFVFVVDQLGSLLAPGEHAQLLEFGRSAGALGTLISQHEQIDVETFRISSTPARA